MCMKPPGIRKSRGETDLEALMPLHPPPTKATAATPSSKKTRTALLLVICDTDIKRKHQKVYMVSKQAFCHREYRIYGDQQPTFCNFSSNRPGLRHRDRLINQHDRQIAADRIGPSPVFTKQCAFERLVDHLA